VQANACEESSKKSSVGCDRMRPGYPFSGEGERNVAFSVLWTHFAPNTSAPVNSNKQLDETFREKSELEGKISYEQGRQPRTMVNRMGIRRQPSLMWKAVKELFAGCRTSPELDAGRAKLFLPRIHSALRLRFAYAIFRKCSMLI
jgi:hypothetical protein